MVVQCALGPCQDLCVIYIYLQKTSGVIRVNQILDCLILEYWNVKMLEHRDIEISKYGNIEVMKYLDIQVLRNWHINIL